MNINTTPEEILKGKFSETIKKIEAYYQEANGDVETGQSYSPTAVRSRIANIRDEFYKDLSKLALDITQ